LVAGIAGCLGAAALALVVLLALSAGGSNGGYTVRAIFDDAGNVISGEDVKIEGVKVGSVGSVTPTATVPARAAVVLKIENPGYQDFLADASCTVRPQALIGEKFVDCRPTQLRPEGTPAPPPLKKIPSGQEGAGEYLLPVNNTHSPVDIDLLGDIGRLPERERLTIILNELGTGLAGRGSDLREVIKRANPALQEFDRVLAILASQRHVIAQLNTDSAKALAPLAKERAQFTNFLVQDKNVAEATAAHRGALARNLQDFPPFLKELGPYMERVGHFAEETIPVARDLKAAAPGIDRTFTQLPGFAKSSTTYFESLGKTAKQSGPALVAERPLLAELTKLGAAGQPTANNLSELLSSLRDTGGLERIMDFIFLGTGASNGYDALGHFLRATVVASGSCLNYDIGAVACNRKLFSHSSATATAASSKSSDISVEMARTLAVLKGATPAQAIAQYPGPTTSSGAEPSNVGTAGSTSEPVGGTSAGTTYYTPSAEGSEAGGLLLNYLLGN